MSQAAVILPGSPLTGAAAAADINAAWAAQISMFSGTTAPTLGPGAVSALVEGQDWLDTSLTPNVWRKWDGAAWCPFATVDTIAHVISMAQAWRNVMSDNGSFEIWQRGSGATSSIAVSASSTLYTADRWYLTTGANQACTVTANALSNTPSQIAAGVFRNNGQTGTGVLTFGYPFTADELVRIRGSKVSLSFGALGLANWSPASGTLTCTFYVGTGAAAKRGGGFTGETNVLQISTNLTPGGSENFVSATSAAIVPNTSTQGEVQFTWTPVGTAGANDAFLVDDVQLEVGTFATPYERVPFEKMLLGCKRHYAKTFPYSTAPAQNGGVAGALGANTQVATADVSWNWNFPVSMRVNPTITTFNPSAANASARNVTGAADVAISVDPNSALSPDRVFIETTATVAAQNSNIYIHVAADAGI